MSTSSISVRVDDNLKKDAEELFDDIGLTMSGAITMFLRTAINCNGIPFALKRVEPNETTIAAMKEAEQIAHDPSVKGYTNIDELFRDLNA